MTHKFVVWMVFLLDFSFTSPVLATTYDGKCISKAGELAKCIVNIENNQLSTIYKDLKDQDLNLAIDGKQIKSLAAGEKTSLRLWQSVAKAVLFSPLALVGLLRKNKLTILTLAYLPKDASEVKITSIGVNPKDSFQIMDELEAISGLKFESEPKQHSTSQEKDH